MQYLLSTLTPSALRNIHPLLAAAAVLSVLFLVWSIYLRAEPIGNFLDVRGAAAQPAIPNTGTHAAAHPLTEPMVSFNFDNGFQSAYKALPLFDAAGFKTTHYLITDRIGHSGYVNEAQALSISKRGHEIGAQSETHNHLTQIPEEIAYAEIEGSREDLTKIGIPVSTFAYPYGESSASLAEMVAAAGFLAARGGTGGANDETADFYNLRAFAVGSHTTLVDVRAAVDAAIRDKKWLILVFYRVDDAGQDGLSVSSKTLQDIVQYIKAKNIRVVTTEEGIQRLSS